MKVIKDCFTCAYYEQILHWVTALYAQISYEVVEVSERGSQIPELSIRLNGGEETERMIDLDSFTN